VLAADARRLNAAFCSVLTQGRPFVTMKTAVSLDGYVAARGGSPIPLTGAAANRLVHRERAEVDAIAVGSGTMLADDPQLTPRGAYRQRPLVRVLFDTRLRTPPSARVFSTLAAGPVIIVTAPAAAGGRAAALTSAGAELLPIEPAHRVEAALRALAGRGVSSLVVEGGPVLHRAFWDAGVVDRVQIFVAGRHVGPGGIPWLDAAVMSADVVHEQSARPVGDDVLLEGYVHGAH
jgi:diaminohydroxyphosphoribosylaminopyrimidine deaminase/5-amino-6-(5-phosphoribosylamino)uracil reductase